MTNLKRDLISLVFDNPLDNILKGLLVYVYIGSTVNKVNKNNKKKKKTTKKKIMN